MALPVVGRVDELLAERVLVLVRAGELLCPCIGLVGSRAPLITMPVDWQQHMVSGKDLLSALHLVPTNSSSRVQAPDEWLVQTCVFSPWPRPIQKMAKLTNDSCTDHISRKPRAHQAVRVDSFH